MSRIWITSDLHIGHDRDFVWEARGYQNIQEHDEDLVKRWNETVAKDDTVYILGDVMLRHAKDDLDFSYGLSILARLNGKLTIIRGNHDSEQRIEKYAACENVVSAGAAALYLKYPEESGYTFYLSHYPTLVSHEKPKQMKSAVINLFGHTHQTEHFYDSHPYMYCACLDAHDMRPVELDVILEEVRQMRSQWQPKTE